MILNTDELFNKTLTKIVQEKKEEEKPELEEVIEELASNDGYSFREHLLEEAQKQFPIQVCERGEDYYNRGHVLSVYKDGETYFAKVLGKAEKVYDVSVTVKDDSIDMNCNCPYELPCKHVYATLLAIDNGEYEEVTLKEEIEEKAITAYKLFENIPADEVKAYILKGLKEGSIDMDCEDLECVFSKYLPKQDYAFYYNNLYNSLVMDEDYEELVDDYLARVKEYISDEDFLECFKIIKSIIEAYNEAGFINDDDYLISILPEIGMYLRVAYRKIEPARREKMNSWIAELKNNNFYDNYYLEDIILGVGRLRVSGDDEKITA